MAGKGSSPRPIEDWESFSNNWDAIFGKRVSSNGKTPASKPGNEGSTPSTLATEESSTKPPQD